jgi:hypothetical protein
MNIFQDLIMKTTPIATGELIPDGDGLNGIFLNFTIIDNISMKKIYDSLKVKSSSEIRKRIKTQPKQNFTKEYSNPAKRNKDGRYSDKYKQNQTLTSQQQVTPFRVSTIFKLRPDSSMTESETRSSIAKSKFKNTTDNASCTGSKILKSIASKFLYESASKVTSKTHLTNAIKHSKVFTQQKHDKSAVKKKYKRSIRENVKKTGKWCLF